MEGDDTGFSGMKAGMVSLTYCYFQSCVQYILSHTLGVTDNSV